MASLKDLASRVKEYLTPKPLVSPIVGQQPVKKTFANDNEGWIRGGKFTPGQQLGEIKQNFSNWQASNRQALQQPLPQSLQPAARFMGVDKPRTPGILSPLAGMQRFELPSFNTPYKGINFIGNLAKSFPETIINTPRNIAVGGGRIEEEVRNAKKQGRQVDASAILKGLAPLAEGTYDLATMGLTAPIKNIVKEGAEYGLKQAFKKGAIKGATIGGFGGLTYGIDKQYEKDFDLVEVAQSVLGGSLLGGTIGGASGAVGHIKGLLNVPKEVAGQLRELNGRYKAGDTPVKPKGMTKAQWDFQIKFNNKYKRNPYEPVTYQDMKKAFDYEVGKRTGLQARDINQDKKPLTYEGIQDKGLTPEVKTVKEIVRSTDSSGVPVKDIRITSKPVNASFDEALDFAKKAGLKDAEIDDFLNLNSTGKIYHNTISTANPDKVIKAYDNFLQSRSGLTPEVTTKAIKTPQLGMQPETSTVLPKKISAELQTKPSPELQTVQIKGKASQQSQPFDSIIQEAKKQIGKTQEPKDQTFKQSLDNLYTQWVDRYNPIVKASKTTKEWLKTKGATLRPENDPEYLVRRLTGAGGIADYRFRTELDPVIKQAESFGIDKGDLDVYLANRRMAGFGQVGRDIYGVDPKKSSQIVSALEGKYGENIKNIADQLYSYQNKGFQEMVDAGFISPESAKVIQSQNPDYSPLYRVMDEVDDYLGLPTRKTMQGSQPIAKIKGSTKQIESPLESVIGNTFRQRAAIEKNRVAQSIVDLQTITDLGFKKVSKSSPDTITVWRNGQKEYWNVGKDIAETAKGVNEEQMNVVLKVLQAPASLLRQGATGRNPEFMIPNIVRDQLDAGITSKYGYIPFVDYVSGLKSMLGNDDIYQKWQSSGAKIDLGELGGKKSISKLFDEKTAKKGLFNWLGEGLDFLGQYSEVPTRVGLFKKAYKKTGNELIAALESRDATVDFARMGSKMKVANSIIPFLNVGVQGFDKLVRSIKNNPSKLAFNMALYGATPAIATTLYNLQNHPEEYAEIPQYEKDDNFIIVKGRNENGNVSYIKIPKGNILPVISNPIENFLAFASGQDTQSVGKLSLNLFGDLLPVVESGGSVKEVLTKTIGSNIPQAFKPAAETLLNKSFYKYDPNKEQSKDIVPSYLQKREPYQQYYEWTPKLYQKIGALVNASPLKVQNLAEGYLAGFAKIPANVVEIMSKVSRGEEVRPNEKPLIRRFFGETNPSSAKPAEKTPATPLMERITGKVGASEITPKVLSETQKESLKWKFKSSGQEAQQVADGVYFVKGSDGDANFIDISQEIPEPKYSGVESIDKKLKSQYKGDLTRRGNDVVKLYEKGQINEEQAKSLLDEIEIKYDSTLAPKKPKKPKSIKIRSVKYSTPKLTKTARKSAPKISISTVKLPKSVKRNITISKPKKISVKGFKNTLSSSVKLS